MASNVTLMPEGLDLSGQLVKVHQNLNNGMWTVKHGNSPVFHVHACALRRVSFHVSKAGRQRVIDQHQRAVHAWVEGIWCEPAADYSDWALVSYNPFNGLPYFYARENRAPVYLGHAAMFSGLRQMHVQL